MQYNDLEPGLGATILGTIGEDIGSFALEAMVLDPLRISVMDVDEFVKKKNALEVTSSFIREPSSPNFHPGGLFSEQIFGEIGSPDRLVQHGYINLRTRVFHPRLFRTILKLKRMYEEIASGKTYATFDKTVGDFIKAKDTDEDAETGFSFFVKHINDIKFESTGSITRDTKIQVIEKYRSLMFITKHLVLPAGIRDIEAGAANSQSEEINKLYGSLLRLAQAIPVDGTESKLYDGVRWAMQRKVVAIYEYLKNITDGKKGYFQGRYGARALALGTRNVISAANTNAAKPDSPQAIKSGETMVPLFQCMKAMQPLVIYQLKALFFNSVIEEGAAQVSVIDAKSRHLGYVDVSIAEKDKFLTTDGLVNFINSYKDVESRHMPVVIKGSDDKYYYFYQVYIDNGKVYIVRSLNDLKSLLAGAGMKFDRGKLHPMTRAEMFYIATHMAAIDKYCTVTRYPITGAESVYPSKVHLISTVDSNILQLSLLTNPDVAVELPHFPVIGSPSVDSVTPHPSQLVNLGGDKHSGRLEKNGHIIESVSA